MRDLSNSSNGEGTELDNQNALQVSVIIPTFCEVENLRELVSRLDASLSKAKVHSEIIIVDDDSPDGTAAVGRELAKLFSLRVHVRAGKRGLSTAVLEGMQLAQGKVLVVMDGDLSHPPETAPILVKTIMNGTADFALASRYVKGGGADEVWTLSRRCISRIATLLARPLTSVRDPMSGYFALSKNTFLQHANQLRPLGFKRGLEITVKCKCKRIVEVPILFRQRSGGQSKLNSRESFAYVAHLLRLYCYRLLEKTRKKNDLPVRSSM